jgi:hypothetical protein
MGLDRNDDPVAVVKHVESTWWKLLLGNVNQRTAAGFGEQVGQHRSVRADQRRYAVSD